MKKILKRVSIGVHAHTACNADICHKVLNGPGGKEKGTDVFGYKLPYEYQNIKNYTTIGKPLKLSSI